MAITFWVLIHTKPALPRCRSPVAPWETTPGSDPLNFSNARHARALKPPPPDQAASGSEDPAQVAESAPQQPSSQPSQQPAAASVEEVTERLPGLSIQEPAPSDQPSAPQEGAPAAEANGAAAGDRPLADDPAAGASSLAAEGPRHAGREPSGATQASRGSMSCSNGDPTELSNVARLLEVTCPWLPCMCAGCGSHICRGYPAARLAA